MDSKTTGNITVTIPEWIKNSSDPKIVMYKIQVQKKGTEDWYLEYRFSQFDDLRKSLKKTYSNLPQLPGKSIFKVSDDSELQERKVKLQEFLTGLLQRPDLFNSDELKQFLQLDQHAAEIMVNPPKLLGETKGFSYGIRDFLYVPKSGVLFALTGNMSATSRFDSYMSNLGKKDKKDEVKKEFASVGALECWMKKDDGEGEFNFQRVWTKTFPYQAICLYWDQATCQLFVGLDEGYISVVKVPEESGYVKFEEVYEEKIHEGRVMGVYYHELTNTAYSISEDKTLKSIKDGQVAHVIKESEKGLTALRGDSDFKRLFISNRQGNIFIYDISSGTPVRLSVLQTSQKGAIRGLQVDTVQNYLFTGGFDDGEIGVFNLEKPGKEKYVTQTASFKGKTNVRFIEWSTQRGEIFSGCKDGTITVWNARKAQPIYVLKSHPVDITNLQWFADQNILITSSKEKSIKFWQLPKEWRDKKLEAEEDDEWRNKVRKDQIDRTKDQLEAAKDDSDEDDLLGWHNF